MKHIIIHYIGWKTFVEFAGTVRLFHYVCVTLCHCVQTTCLLKRWQMLVTSELNKHFLENSRTWRSIRASKIPWTSQWLAQRDNQQLAKYKYFNRIIDKGNWQLNRKVPAKTSKNGTEDWVLSFPLTREGIMSVLLYCFFSVNFLRAEKE